MRFPVLVTSALLLASFAGGCFAQVAVRAPATHPTPIPVEMLYDVFFFRVAWLDQMAQKEEARGRDGSSIRSLVRRQAKLKANEEETLKAVAAGYRAKVAAILASTRAAAMAGSKGDPQANANQRKQLVLDHIGRLRSMLSRVAFLQLDTYVRLTVKPEMGPTKK